MPNWIDDNLTIVNFPKVDVTPPPGSGLTGWVIAADMNSMYQALLDIQAFLRATVRSYIVNGNAGTISAGTPVYEVSPGHFDKAIASSLATSICIGLTIGDCAAGAIIGVQHANTMTLLTTQWDARTGGSGGLTSGTVYYVDPTTAGALTATAPSTVGQFQAPVGYAFSTTQMALLLTPPLGL
jgi:hypothetical protein